MDDPVRPSIHDVEGVMAISSRIWSHHKEAASIEPGIPLDSIYLKNILGKVPAYLAHGRTDRRIPFTLHQRNLRDNTASELLISGYSRWQTSAGACNLPPRFLHRQLLLGVQRSTTCVFSDESDFKCWPGVQGLPDDAADGNYLAIFVLAWAYILSALWVEMQQAQDVCRGSPQNSDSLYYRGCKAQWAGEDLHNPSKRIEVDLDTIGSDAARWWAAVLAPGEGWAATVRRKGQTYRSPWSVQTATIQSFVLRAASRHHKSHDTEFSPPSSTDALRFLSDFCTTHNLHSQGLAALSAAMYLPFHNGATATLPCPKPCLKPTTAPCITSSPASPQVAVDEERSLLPYYMTISCNIWGIRSLLCSTFFNLEIYCNLVGPWLEPAFKIIDPIVERGEYMLLANMMAKRQPLLGSLWLGAILTGAAKPILRAIRSGQYALELNSSAWTSTTQSFLTVSPSQLDASDDPIIHRSDECRLLFLTGSEEHSRVPICPWKPFGTTSLCDTETEVQTHSHCKGHSLQYMDWCWDLEGGMKLQDEGFDTTAETISKGDSPATTTQLAFQGTEALKSHTLSEVATRSIFAWLRSTGYPSSERDIRTHPWLDLEDSDEEPDESDGSDDLSNCSQNRSIGDWLDGIEIAAT